MSEFDRFDEKGQQAGRSAQDPPRRARMVVPDDSNDLPWMTTAFQVGAAEDLRVMTARDEIVTIPAAFLVAGTTYSAQLRRIYDTGSGAGHTTVLIWGPD